MKKPPKYPVILLAGSPDTKDALMEYADTDYKSLIPINNVPMIAYVIRAIERAGVASHLLIVGVEAELWEMLGIKDLPFEYEFLNIRGGQTEKITSAARHLLEKYQDNETIFQNDHFAIITSADIPSVTPEAIIDLIEATKTRSADFYYSVVAQDDMDKAFPNNGRSWMKIKEGNFCGADMALVNLDVIEDSVKTIDHLTENRKNFALGLFLKSPLTFIRYALGRLKLADVSELMTKILKVKSQLYISRFAELAFDVDKPYQLDLIREKMEN